MTCINKVLFEHFDFKFGLYRLFDSMPKIKNRMKKIR